MWYYSYPDIKLVENLPYFLHSIGLHELQPAQVKPDGNHYDQFLYGTKGTGTLIVEGHTYEVKENDGFFIPGGTPHEYYPHGSEWNLRWMVPRGDGLKRLYSLLGIRTGLYHISDPQSLDAILNQMHQYIIESGNVGNVFSSALVSQFITEFARQADILNFKDPARKLDTTSKHFKVIENYVAYHFMHKIQMEDLCEVTGLSAQHVCRIIKAKTSMRPMEYVSYFRINKAKEFLKDSDHSISEISVWSGFENENYFWKMFKKFAGTTPGKFRSNLNS